MREEIQANSAKFNWYELGKERMSHFSQPERLAILHYLEYRAETDEFKTQEIKQALDRYWTPSLTVS